MGTRLIKIILLTVLVVLFGYLRDTLFVRIAWHEKVITTGAVPPEPHVLFNFLSDLSLRQLAWTRYLFTGAFIGIFFGISWFMVKWFFNHKSNFRLLYIVFTAVLSVTIVLYGLGWITAQQAAIYPLLRYVTGIIETPVIIILLFPLLWGMHKMASVKER